MGFPEGSDGRTMMIAKVNGLTDEQISNAWEDRRDIIETIAREIDGDLDELKVLCDEHGCDEAEIVGEFVQAFEAQSGHGLADDAPEGVVELIGEIGDVQLEVIDSI